MYIFRGKNGEVYTVIGLLFLDEHYNAIANSCIYLVNKRAPVADRVKSSNRIVSGRRNTDL